MPEDVTAANGEPSELPLAAPRDRREQIRARVVDHGFVRIEDLAETFGVSLMTIHRDLDALQTQGWLRKVRGGATAQPSAHHHGDIRHRAATMVEAKQEIAESALELVSQVSRSCWTTAPPGWRSPSCCPVGAH